MTETKPHHGRNIKRFREWAGIKQDALAAELNWSQQKVSLLEQKEEIEDDVLEEVVKILKVPVDAIKNLDDSKAVNYFNSFNDGSVNHGAVYAFNSNFNPIEKVIQLYDEKIALYERMLKDKSDMIAKLEELLLKGKS